MKISQIKVKKVENNNGKVKAFASFVLEECFAVHSIRIIEANNKLFLAFPNEKYNDKYIDLCHPITSAFRKQIEDSVLNEYNNCIKR